MTVNGPAAKTCTFSFSGSPTFVGAVAFIGNSLTNRLLLASSVIGTARTITINGSHGAHANVNFRDLTIAGTAGTLTGTSIGDGLNNSGITFTGAVTRYWVGGTGNWSNTAQWSTSTGGASGASVPLPQDTAIIDGNSGTSTMVATLDMPWACKDFDASNMPSGAQVSFGSVNNVIFGSLSFGTGTSTTGTFVLSLQATDARTITSNGVVIGTGINIQRPGCTYTLQDNFACWRAGSTAGVTLINGTFDANDKNVAVGSLTDSGSAARALKMGAGTWTINGTTAATVWSLNASGLTLTASTSIIDITGADSLAKGFVGGGLTYGTLRYKAAGSGQLNIVGNNTFTDLDLECTTARTIQLPASGTQTVNRNLTLQGAAGQTLSLVSATPGTATTITVKAGGVFAGSNYSLSSDVTVKIAPNTLRSVYGPTVQRAALV